MKKTLLIALLSVGVAGFAQDAKKMAKHLTVTVNPKFDKTQPISFDRKNPEKHGFDDIAAQFRNAFIAQGFTINDKPRYLFVMDYDYGYVISGYRFQYSNLTGEVVDLQNNREVVGTFVYDGRFEINMVPPAVATAFKK